MAVNQRSYDMDYKIQAVKLVESLGSCKKAAYELGISNNTLYGWVKAAKAGRLNIGEGAHTPESAMSLNEEVIKLRNQVRTLNAENARLKKENAFLEEASAFFAASRLKSTKEND